jgi:GMP synthase (glutamine-hydrolysing)
VEASERFVAALEGVSDPEDKRRIIGREFIRCFESAEREIVAAAGAGGDPVEFLVQGTLYPDVVESGGGAGASTIKSHHNVGGLPDDLQFQLVEPLRTLFKDEVRQVGEQLGLPDGIVWRQPFPGPGLAIRIVGAVTGERLEILREADAIVRDELTRAGLDRDIWQFPVVLLGRRTLRRRPRRRPHVRPPARTPPGDQRRRDDRRLGAAAVRPAGADLDAHHQRGARDQPGGARPHQQAAGHDRVGVSPSCLA